MYLTAQCYVADYWCIRHHQWAPFYSEYCILQFPDIFQPHQTMQQFMWQPDLLQVAKFLDAGMKRLQTVDPNEGSNI